MLKLNDILKYSNKSALHNPIQVLLYAIAFPVAKLLSVSRFTPNLVTLISVFFAILSFISLANCKLSLFYIFWTLSYLLDYADGTLARLTNNIGKSALRLDHITDQLKLILIFLGFGVYFDDGTIWILTLLSSSTFLFYSLLNHELFHAIKLNEKPVVDRNQKSGKIKLIKRFLLRKFKVLKLIYIFSYGTLYIINGHTLMLFYFIPVKYDYAIFCFSYFISVCCVHSFHRMVSLSKLKKI